MATTIHFINKGRVPTFTFHCRVCKSDFEVCDNGGSILIIEEHPYESDAVSFVFSATMDCPVCGANIRSRKIRVSLIDKDKEA